MESTLSPEKTIEYISQPAFLAKDGIVTAVNNAASQMQIKVGTSINELIKVGTEDYAGFRSGKLYLELSVGRAWVSICDDVHLFNVEGPYPTPELKALALAAQHLRMPLSNAMSSIELLKQNEALENSDSLRQQVSSVNRSIYSLLRSVCNMSDASPAGISCQANLQVQNATAIFDEIFEKLTTFTEKSGQILEFTGLKQPVECLLDPQLMERAILNMVSNAVKFSPAGTTIRIIVKHTGHRLSIAVENTISEEQRRIYSNAFLQFRRIPTIEDGLYGIGLGMSVISGVMAAHSGTVLLDTAKKNTDRITLSFPVRTTANSVVRSPIQLLGGYTGGIDSYLVELSDILPNHFYE